MCENLAVLTVFADAASVFMAQRHLASVSTDPRGFTGALRAQVRCYSVDFILGARGSLEAKLPLSWASQRRDCLQYVAASEWKPFSPSYLGNNQTQDEQHTHTQARSSQLLRVSSGRIDCL